MNIIFEAYAQLHMILERHIFITQEEDAKPCMENTLHIRSNDDTHHTHTNKLSVRMIAQTHQCAHKTHTQMEYNQTKRHL
jgi:hypothetical protein